MTYPHKRRDLSGRGLPPFLELVSGGIVQMEDERYCAECRPVTAMNLLGVCIVRMAPFGFSGLFRTCALDTKGVPRTASNVSA